MAGADIAVTQIKQQEQLADKEALKLLELEEVRRLQEQVWQKFPMVWLEERFGEDQRDYDWSLFPEYKKHKWDGTPNPLLKVWECMAAGKWCGVEAGTGTGKTRLLSRVVFWFLDCFKDALVVTTAPKQAQLTLNLWAEINKAMHKFKKIRPKAALYNLRLVVEEKDEKVINLDPNSPDYSKSWHCIGVVSGVGNDEESATKMQGFHRQHMLIISEETPGVQHAVMTALKNTCTDVHNIILAVGNPDSQQDALHQFCTQLPNVEHVILSALDFPNVVLDKSIFPGAVTNQSIDRRKAEYGVRSPMYQSRVRGIAPAQGVDSLIQTDWCDVCATNNLKYDGTYHAVGVDVAQSNDGDKACLAWFTGNILREVQEFHCNNATHLAYNIIKEDSELIGIYNKYDTYKVWDFEVMNGFIGVDTVGVGVATFNALQDEGFEPLALQGGQWADCIPEETYVDTNDGKEKTRKCYKFQGLRSQMYWELREDLRHGRIHLAIEDKLLLREIIVELTSIKVVYKDNFIAVESKEAIRKRLGGKSPNKADAIVYANWTRKGYRTYTGGLPMLGG